MHRPIRCLILGIALLGACVESGPRAPLYVDVTEISGLQFEHQNGGTESLHLPVILGSGVALFDVDNDSDLDVYLVQGKPGSATPDEIWLNETVGGQLRFSRMPPVPALSSSSAGMGIAIGDPNLDGRLDVLVTTVGSNRLLLNTKEGFVQSTSEVLGKTRVWSSSAVWLDANADSRPDVYVANVARFDPQKVCRAKTSRRDYCDAGSYATLSDQLFLNAGTTASGDIIFEDASYDWGLAAINAPSLGVRASDYNNDGLPDLYVSAFGESNLLWMNLDSKAFDERALASGASSGFLGRYHNSIGVDAADLDHDDDPDLIVSHDRGEPHQVLLNDGKGNFIASSMRTRGASEADSGSGLVLLDVNADGYEDVFVANGALRRQQAQLDAGDAMPLRQSNALYVQQPVIEASTQAGVGLLSLSGVQVNDAALADSAIVAETPVSQEGLHDAVIEFGQWIQTTTRLTSKPQVSRSVATGDLDNDGDLDLVITNNGGPVQLLRSNLNPVHWVGINPVSIGETTAIGTRVWMEEPETPGFREVRRAHGYLSASDPRLIFYPEPGAPHTLKFRVQWSDGSRETYNVVSEARYHTLVKGQGQQ